PRRYGGCGGVGESPAAHPHRCPEVPSPKGAARADLFPRLICGHSGFVRAPNGEEAVWAGSGGGGILFAALGYLRLAFSTIRGMHRTATKTMLQQSRTGR